MLRLLSSLRLFFSLLAMLGAAFVYQTIFNKGAPIYGTGWFATLGLLLAANIAACALQRLRAAPLHFTLLHAGLVVIIAGAFTTRFCRFEAGMPLHAGEESSLVQTAAAYYTLPFSVKLNNFRLEYYTEPQGVITVEEGGRSYILESKEGAVIKTPGGAALKVLRLVKDFGLTGKNEVVEKSPYWFNPAAQLEIVQGGKKRKLWFFSNFPGMHAQDLPFSVAYTLEQAEIKNFASSVTVKPAAGPEIRAEIAVNKPLKVGGYTLYQASYDPADAAYSLLTVTMDRGLWVVYAGFALFLTGVLLWLRK